MGSHVRGSRFIRIDEPRVLGLEPQTPQELHGRKILVVGNLTVGGSGKTPLVIRLCHMFGQAGLKVAVVSRGYGRKQSGMVVVQADSTVDMVGDEPLVTFQRTGVPVVVSSDRCQAAQHLFENGIDIVIADDGLQHHRLPRFMEICVIDGDRAFGNRLLLPAGPLREPLERLSTVDHVVVNGGEHFTSSPADTIRMNMIPGLLFALNGNETWRPSQFTGCRVNAVAGIGNPDRFFKSLENAGMQVVQYAFPDHHHYREEDFNEMDAGIPIIMTEKDAVKCKTLALKNAWFLAVEASLPSDWENKLLQEFVR